VLALLYLLGAVANVIVVAVIAVNNDWDWMTLLNIVAGALCALLFWDETYGN
jgi:hypothetical protein